MNIAFRRNFGEEMMPELYTRFSFHYATFATFQSDKNDDFSQMSCFLINYFVLRDKHITQIIPSPAMY